MSGAVTRRRALATSAAAAIGLAAGVAAVQGAPLDDAALTAQADVFRDLCRREELAWAALDEDEYGETPALKACRALSQACRDAGAALAEFPARTPIGLAAKASAMLTLVAPRLDTQAALSEHEGLVVSILRGAAQLGGGALA